MQLGRKVTDEKAAAWTRDMSRFLWDQEQPLLMFRTSGMSLDLVLATTGRVIGWSSTGVSKGPKAAILWSEMVDYRYNGFSDKLVIRKVAGDEVNLGPVHKDDRSIVDQLFRQHGPSVATPALAGPAASPAPTAASTISDPFGGGSVTQEASGGDEGPSPRTAWIEELSRLGDLFERGLLDDREFRLAKQKLLREGS
jgi:hypothetical protein